MSINKFQEKVFRTGCGSAVLYVCAAVFFAGMFYVGCGMGGGLKGQDGDESRVVAIQVADIKVYYDDLQKIVEGQFQKTIEDSGRPNSADLLSPMDQAQIESNVLNSIVEGNAGYYLAQKAGVKFTDSAMSREEEKQFRTFDSI